MNEISTIGLDIAKSVFQVHGVDVVGAVVIRQRISRAKVLEYFGDLPPCLIGIEACPSAHHFNSFVLNGAPNCHHSEQNCELGALDRPIVIGPLFEQLSGEAKLRQADIG